MASRAFFRGLGALAIVASVALASAAPVRADENAEARAYFDQGSRLLTQALRSRGERRQRLLQEAFDAYVESMRIVRTRNAVYNAGITLEELGRLPEAFSYYAEYLGFQGIPEADQREAQARIDRVRQRVAVIAVSSDPPGAEIRIDRRDLASRGVTPLEVAVPPGAHRVFLSRHGHEDATVEAEATVGGRVTAEARLAPLPVPVTIRAPRTGTLTIDGEPVEPGTQISVLPGRHVIRFEPTTVREVVVVPGEPLDIDLGLEESVDVPMGRLHVTVDVPGRVSVDGAVVGQGAEVEVQLRPGTRRLRVEAPGRVPAESEIDVRAGQTSTVAVAMRAREEGTTLGVLPVITWAVAGMAGVAGALLGVQALGANADYEADATPARFDDVEQKNLVADLVLGAAVALGITALVLTLVNDDLEQDPSTVTLGAAPLPGGGHVSARVALGDL